MNRTITPERIDAMRIKCTTDADRIVAYLWYTGQWHPTHELMGRDTPFGFIGSAGHVRARELARNECAEKLKSKVERARGREIGLDPRFEYFRYAPTPKIIRAEAERIGRENIEWFDNYQPSTA